MNFLAVRIQWRDDIAPTLSRGIEAPDASSICPHVARISFRGDAVRSPHLLLIARDGRVYLTSGPKRGTAVVPLKTASK